MLQYWSENQVKNNEYVLFYHLFYKINALSSPTRSARQSERPIKNAIYLQTLPLHRLLYKEQAS